MSPGKHTCRRQNFHDWLHGTTRRVLALDKVEYNPSRTKSPSLLSVNHEVRAEAGKVYYEHYNFEVFIDTGRSSRPLEEINLWSRAVVRELETHLRDLRVHINWIGHCYQFETSLHVRFTRGKGLEATGSRAAFHLENESYEGEPNDFASLLEYVADCEAKRIDRGQMGEAVVGFFLDIKAVLRKACFGPRVEEIDGEDLWTNDEPDAANRYEW